MRLVFISSVTAMTPLRTISVTTGSGRRGLALARFDFAGLSFRSIGSLGCRPRESGTHLAAEYGDGWVPAFAGKTTTKSGDKNKKKPSAAAEGWRPDQAPPAAARPRP